VLDWRDGTGKRELHDGGSTRTGRLMTIWSMSVMPQAFTAACRHAGDDRLLSGIPFFLFRREGISADNALQSGLLSYRVMHLKANRLY